MKHEAKAEQAMVLDPGSVGYPMVHHPGYTHPSGTTSTYDEGCGTAVLKVLWALNGRQSELG